MCFILPKYDINQGDLTQEVVLPALLLSFPLNISQKSVLQRNFRSCQSSPFCCIQLVCKQRLWGQQQICRKGQIVALKGQVDLRLIVPKIHSCES